MFSISKDENGSIRLSGTFDSSRAENAQKVFGTVDRTCTIDCEGLDFISSAGLGIIMATYKRLAAKGETIRLVNVGKTVKSIFLLARFDRLFDIE